MSALLDKPDVIDPQDAAILSVIGTMRDHMKPKAAAKAKANLEAYAARLETWEGCRLPANVTPLRWHGSRREQALATEAQRQERARHAAAIRALIGRAF